MGFYEDLRDKTAYPLMKEFGFACHIVDKTGEVFNPATGGLTSVGTEVLYATIGVYGDFVKAEEPNSGTKVRAQQVYVEAKNLRVEPTTSMRFKVGTTYQDILAVKLFNPGNVNLLYLLTVKL